MPNISPDTGGSLTVSDAAGSKRVEIGRLTDTTGAPTGEFGVKVWAPGGTTEILDGVNDTLRVVASGSLSVAFAAAPSTGTTFVDITSLGTLTLPRLAMLMVTPNFFGTLGTQMGSAYGINASGTVDWSILATVSQVAGALRVRVTVNSILANPGGSGDLKYYVLTQDAA